MFKCLLDVLPLLTALCPAPAGSSVCSWLGWTTVTLSTPVCQVIDELLLVSTRKEASSKLYPRDSVVYGKIKMSACAGTQ